MRARFDELTSSMAQQTERLAAVSNIANISVSNILVLGGAVDTLQDGVAQLSAQIAAVQHNTASSPAVVVQPSVSSNNNQQANSGLTAVFDDIESKVDLSSRPPRQRPAVRTCRRCATRRRPT